MNFEINRIQAIVFDYGNTLIEFTHTHLEKCDAALAKALEKSYGYVDHKRLRDIRNQERVAPYSGNFQENHLPTITTNLVRTLYNDLPSPALLDELLDIRFKTFVALVRAPNYLHQLLMSIIKKFRIGLLSNYPCGNAIRASMERIEIDQYFHSVVVSADIGHVKPHPLPFAAVIDELGVQPNACLFVGDNWLGDIQGAKRAGMKAAHTVQFETPENFSPKPGDLQPDITIHHLSELVDLFKIREL